MTPESAANGLTPIWQPSYFPGSFSGSMCSTVVSLSCFFLESVIATTMAFIASIPEVVQAKRCSCRLETSAFHTSLNNTGKGAIGPVKPSPLYM